MYFLIVVQTTKTGEVAQAIFKYDDIYKAESAYHGELSAACISDTLTEDLCILMDEEGQIYQQRKITKS